MRHFLVIYIGSIVIAIGQNHYAHGITDEPTSNTFSVPYLDLEHICAEWPEVSLLKLDIEGSETLVLETFPLLLSRTWSICMEAHGVDRHQRCIELLVQTGWRKPAITRIQGEGAGMLSSIWAERQSA